MPTPQPTSGMNLHELVARGERIFPSHPQVARYFPSVAMESARKRLTRTIDRGDGPGLVVGSAGTGKSLLLQVLAAQYHEQTDVVLLACARICTRRALLQAILFELGLPYRLRDEGQLRLSLLDHLLSPEQNGSGLLLLVDEAQSLSVSLLEELRVMTNLVRCGVPRVRLVLAGSAALEESFASPDLESFSQRLAARCYLAPFSRQETTQFVRAQVAAAGAVPETIFAAEAWDAIFEATDGVPRLVNQLCDRALVAADLEGRTLIDRDGIQAVWADLQQLPMPLAPTSSATTPARAATQVVEFGGLSDEEPQADWRLEAMSVVIESAPYDSATLEPADLELDISEFAEPEIAELELEVEPAEEVVAAAWPVEHEAAPSELTVQVPAAARLATSEQRFSAGRNDPFAEEFAEEEVVLDSFATWDEMFRADTPRVQNNRNREFASLVQYAMDARQAIEVDAHEAAADTIRIEDVELDLTECDDENDELPFDEADPHWPPIRLAVVTDFPPHGSAPQPRTSRGAEPAASFSPVTSPESVVIRSEAAALPDDETPILIVEDDPVDGNGVKPGARREEYRNLFSRLRSG